MQKIREYISITPKSVVIILILLIILDYITRIYWKTIYQDPGSARLLNEETSTLRNHMKYFADSDGYKILYLGDSQTYGSAVKNGSETIPAQLEAELKRRFPNRKIKVFNWAYKGYGISENYFLLNYLSKAKFDLVIYNISPAWFNRNKIIEHPNVLFLADHYLGESLINKTGLNIEKGIKEKLEKTVEQDIGTLWSLYGTKSALTTSILGKPLREKITDFGLLFFNKEKLLQKASEENKLFINWYKKDWHEEFKTMSAVGNFNLQNNNPQVVFYNLILKLIDNKETDALIYASPQNIDMLKKYNKIDEKQWNKGLKDIELISSKSRHVKYFDFTQLVDNQYFTDTIHMTKEGNAIVAKRLSNELSKGLEGSAK